MLNYLDPYVLLPFIIIHCLSRSLDIYVLINQLIITLITILMLRRFIAIHFG